MAIQITLSEDQLAIAEKEATRRQTVNESAKLRGRNRAPSQGQKALEMHRMGCLGEAAVAAYLDMEEHLFANTKAIRNSADLPGNIEVKTRSKHSYDLLVQLDDDPNKLFVLVTTENTEIRIVGWIHGKDAMKKEFVREFVRGRPCYAVPQCMLNPPETMKSEGISIDKKIVNLDQVWITEEAGEHGKELRLNFGKDLLEKLNWHPGDMLTWELIPSSNTCAIKKYELSQAEK